MESDEVSAVDRGGYEVRQVLSRELWAGVYVDREVGLSY